MALDDTPRPARTGRFRRDGDARLREQRRQALITSMLSELRERTPDGDRAAAARDPLLDPTRTSLLARDEGVPETG
jgi:hypothetical protein